MIGPNWEVSLAVAQSLVSASATMSADSSPSTSQASPLSQSTPNSTSMPSTRTSRSATGKNAADAITAWRSGSRAIYVKEKFRAAVEAIPGPRVLCYDSVTTVSGASTRSPLLLPDGDYGPVIKLVETVAHLLVTSAPVRRRIMISIDLLYAESAEAQEQFDVLHPGENEPTEELFLAFVTTRFPNVILQETTKESSLLWGSVNTEGNEEGADMSEMFISKGLVQVYLDTQVCPSYPHSSTSLSCHIGRSSGVRRLGHPVCQGEALRRVCSHLHHYPRVWALSDQIPVRITVPDTISSIGSRSGWLCG